MTTTAGSTNAPPRGQLFQEYLRHDPFWMLIACMLVNLTCWEQAEPAFLWMRRTASDPINLAVAEPEDLHDALRPLGLWRRRAVILPRFARAWLRRRPVSYDDVMRLPGCGKYAADSWAIFVEGRSDVEPRDGKLNWYMDRQRETA